MLAPGTTVADTAVRTEARSVSEAIPLPLGAYIRIVDGNRAESKGGGVVGC